MHLNSNILDVSICFIHSYNIGQNLFAFVISDVPASLTNRQLLQILIRMHITRVSIHPDFKIILYSICSIQIKRFPKCRNINNGINVIMVINK